MPITGFGGRSWKPRPDRGDQHIGHRRAFGHRADHDAIRIGDRQILERVDREIDPALAQRRLDLAGEDALSAHKRQRRLELDVAGRDEDLDLDRDARVGRKQRLPDLFDLGARQVGAPRAYPNDCRCCPSDSLSTARCVARFAREFLVNLGTNVYPFAK